MEMIEVSENSRTYNYPDGYSFTLENVVAMCVRPSGNHRLKTADGHLHIVTPGWYHIEIDADYWTF